MYNLIKRKTIYLDAPKILMKQEKEIADPKAEAEKILEEAKRKADSILNSAKEKAQNILENARAEYHEKKEQADELLKKAQENVEEMKRSIREELEKKLMAEYEVKFNAQLERFEKLILKIEEKRTTIVEKLVYKLLEIFKVFIGKVSLEAITVPDELILKKLRALSNSLLESQKIILKLSSQDKDVFTEDVIEDLKSRFKTVNFKFDDSLNKGDLIVETDFGIYNFTTAEALNVLNDIITEELSEN